jgi:hypothetical protein
MKLKKNNYELDEYFKLRKKFIELFKTNNKKDFIYVENLSFIFINMVFLKCRYSNITEKNILLTIQSSKSRNLKNIIKNLLNK